MSDGFLTKLDRRRFVVRASGTNGGAVWFDRAAHPQRPAASLAKVLAIADTLGLALRLEAPFDVEILKREQAERMARRLVGLVQGTSGLECQAVDRDEVESMVEQATHELLGGPALKLWSEV